MVYGYQCCCLLLGMLDPASTYAGKSGPSKCSLGAPSGSIPFREEGQVRLICHFKSGVNENTAHTETDQSFSSVLYLQTTDTLLDKSCEYLPKMFRSKRMIICAVTGKGGEGVQTQMVIGW